MLLALLAMSEYVCRNTVGPLVIDHVIMSSVYVCRNRNTSLLSGSMSSGTLPARAKVPEVAPLDRVATRASLLGSI